MATHSSGGLSKSPLPGPSGQRGERRALAGAERRRLPWATPVEVGSSSIARATQPVHYGRPRGVTTPARSKRVPTVYRVVPSSSTYHTTSR